MQISGPIELIKKSIQLFFEKGHLIYFSKIYSPLIPFAIFSVAEKYFVKINYSLPSWVYAVFVLSSFIVYFLVGFAGIYAVGNVVSGRYLSVRETYGSAWKNLWRFSLLAILTFFIVMGGLILLIIPGIIFGVWYSFSRFIFIEKSSDIKESLFKSKALVSGRFWKIFGRLFVFGLFSVLVQIIAGLLPYGLGSLATALGGALFVLPQYLLYLELTVNG